MALTKRYGPYALKLHAMTAQAGGAVYVDGVQAQSLNSQLRTLLEGSDGAVYRSFGTLASGAPALRVTTNDLKALLDAAGLTGMKIDADGTHPGVVAYFQALANGSTRGGAGTHISVTIPNGILVPRSIVMPHQGDARVDAEALARKQSATAPLTFDEAASLPSGVYPATAAAWTLGPWKLSATTVEGLQEASIDTGIELVVDAGDSDISPTFVAIQTILPTVRLRCRHADLTSVLTEDGAYYAATQVVGYARKRAEGGSFVADGTAEHIKFTLGKCRAEWVSIGGDPADIEVLLTPWATPGETPVNPIAINTASAIT